MADRIRTMAYGHYAAERSEASENSGTPEVKQ